MTDLPSKRLREEKKAVVNSNSVTSTLHYDTSADCLADAEMSKDETKRKQTTLDQYWSKKLTPEVRTVSKPTPSENTAVQTVPETLKMGSSLVREVETTDGNVVEAVTETLKYESSLDTNAMVATLEYDSGSAALSQNSPADAVSATGSDLSPEHLELGASFDELAAICEARLDLIPLCPSANHAVLFIPGTADEHCTSIPKPFPENAVPDETRWDNNHVRLPYSVQNKLLLNKVIVSRWGKIASVLSATQWNSSQDIENAILSYNKYKWDFTELHRYFQTLMEEEHDLFFSQTMPKVAELAVNLPSICTQPIPLLRKQKTASVTMSQQQAASLLANAFFCTFPSRNTGCRSDDDVARLPSINFNSLYSRAGYSRRARHAKLDCLLHYFRRVTTDMPHGTLTFKRQVP